MGLTVTDAVNDILSLWGIESGGTGTIPDAQTRAINDLNKAVQTIWLNPEKLNYFSRSEFNVTITSATTSAGLIVKSALSGAITGATNATPIVISSTAHGLSSGDVILITGVGGNTAANGRWIVIVVDADHYNLTTDGTTLVAGNGDYTSGGVWSRPSIGIQNVLGNVRPAAGGQPLQPISTKYEYQHYADLYYDGVLPAGPPVAYYLDRETQAGTDSVALTLRVVPAPLVDTALTLDIIADLPPFTWADYTQGTPIPMPHGYDESLLYGLTRKSAMTYFLFFKPERATLIEAEYEAARETLGLAAPEVDEVKPKVEPITNAPWAQRRQR